MLHVPWSMVNGQWAMVHGPLSMVHGPWSMVHGPWSMVHGPWPKVHGPWKYFGPTPWHRLGEICAEIGPRISAQSLFDKNCQKDLAWWFLLMCSSVFNLFKYLCLQLMRFWLMSSFLRFPLEGTVRHYSTHHPRWRIVSSRFCSPIGPHQPGTLSNILCIISYII